MSDRKISFGITPSNVNFAVIFIFLIFILFSNDDSSIRCKLKFASETRLINSKIVIIREQMSRDSIILHNIRNSDEYLERVARENLYMTGVNEIIFKIK